MNSPKHAKLEKELIAVQAPAGSLVCWDNRIPHATCDNLSGYDTREVVFCGFLPHIEINHQYIEKQRESIRKNKAPPAYESSDKNETVDLDWDDAELTEAQRNALLFNTPVTKGKNSTAREGILKTNTSTFLTYFRKCAIPNPLKEHG